MAMLVYRSSMDHLWYLHYHPMPSMYVSMTKCLLSNGSPSFLKVSWDAKFPAGCQVATKWTTCILYLVGSMVISHRLMVTLAYKLIGKLLATSLEIGSELYPPPRLLILFSPETFGIQNPWPSSSDHPPKKKHTHFKLVTEGSQPISFWMGWVFPPLWWFQLIPPFFSKTCNTSSIV